MAEPTCSFCEKPQREVRALIAGPSSRICDECVSLAAHLAVDQVRGGRARPPTVADWTAPEEQLEHWRRVAVVEDLVTALGEMQELPAPVRARAGSLVRALRELLAEIRWHPHSLREPPSSPVRPRKR